MATGGGHKEVRAGRDKGDGRQVDDTKVYQTNKKGFFSATLRHIFIRMKLQTSHVSFLPHAHYHYSNFIVLSQLKTIK